MKHYCDEWINEWCTENGWTDLTFEAYHYWAFPPGAVMPEPIPQPALRLIKAEKGFCQEEKNWLMGAGIVTVISIVSSLILHCPVPLVFAFACNAVTVAKLEVEEA
ncbi:MAG: hypothetical protein DSM107014_08535 [Gomphosphaeria aponina SAG 52.96 = DSM 107014]|uniref:Uncharacterized protein n=1 Tax=Gomphosphaeria aponina SAG 52.96 = DSM 107014 TaxID=1521640 RepID=A0A941JUZ7_9CHRO|nr:hypothetical protein [Gomphosphaeria aponina SAG 52.96 = DSM 107014]